MVSPLRRSDTVVLALLAVTAVVSVLLATTGLSWRKSEGGDAGAYSAMVVKWSPAAAVVAVTLQAGAAAWIIRRAQRRGR